LEDGPLADASELASIVGYTAIACAIAEGDVDGGEDGELIKLDNGMIFEFTEFSLVDEYMPEVIVFERIITPKEAKELHNREIPEPLSIYTLLIGDELVNVIRVR
jgi:hypothetical protein